MDFAAFFLINIFLNFILILLNKKNNYVYNKICMGIGDWGLGIGPNPQSPIPNPQSPIPN